MSNRNNLFHTLYTNLKNDNDNLFTFSKINIFNSISSYFIFEFIIELIKNGCFNLT